MANLVLLTERPDGGIDDTKATADHSFANVEEETAFLEKERNRTSHLQGRPFSIVPTSSVPQTRGLRDAWKLVAGEVSIDMPSARSTRMKQLRRIRDKKLKDSDVEVAREIEHGSVRQDLKVKRQALRDMPPKVEPVLEAITDSSELEIYLPEELS